MKEKLVPYLGNYYLRKPRSVVIMDNATFHAGVKELTEGTGAKLIYLSAYSPELNPIELMFGTCIYFCCCCRCCCYLYLKVTTTKNELVTARVAVFSSH